MANSDDEIVSLIKSAEKKNTEMNYTNAIDTCKQKFATVLIWNENAEKYKKLNHYQKIQKH
jgi:hypothetical protein